MVRALLIATLGAAALGASCYRPSIADCAIGCEQDTNACPDGFTCGSQSRCVDEADPGRTCDLMPDARGSGHDAGTTDGGSGSSACPAAPQDEACGTILASPPAPCVARCMDVLDGSAANMFMESTWVGLQHIPTSQATSIDDNASGSGSGAGAWIALRRASSGSGFVWADGMALGSAGNDDTHAWAPGEPSADTGLHCVEATGSGWVVADCALELPFFIGARPN